MATNTEKPSGKAEQKKSGVIATPALKKEELKKSPVKKEENAKTDENKEIKPVEKKTKRVPKEEACINVRAVHISTLKSIAICKFVKNKKISKAIEDLEQVVLKKKAVPMKGEIPHKSGKRMMSGRYPVRSAKEFLVLLKSLAANATENEIDNPIIVEAIANMGQRPMGRFGAVKRKRTHIRLVAKDKKKIKKKESSKKKIVK